MAFQKKSKLSRRKSHIRGAQFHTKISNARLLKIPNKLAWIAAAVTVVCMVIWNCLTLGSPQVVPSTLLFFVLVIVFQILSWIVFLILDLATRRAYNHGKGNDDTGTERGCNGYADGWSYYTGYWQSSSQSGGADSYTSREEKYEYSYDYGSQESDSGYISLDEAKAMFSLKEPFTMKDLKKARNMLIMNGKIHPDDGGDPEKFKELMRAYDLLAEYIGG